MEDLRYVKRGCPAFGEKSGPEKVGGKIKKYS